MSQSQSLSTNIHAVFDKLGLEKKLHTLGQAQAHVEGLRRELAESKQQVGFWDRINVFTDSSSEERRDELTLQLQKARGTLRTHRKDLDLTLDDLAVTYPPLEIWRRIDVCLGLVRTDLATRGLLKKKKVKKPVALRQALDQLAKRILKIYVPDLDLHALMEILDDEEHCRKIALPANKVKHLDPKLGYAPITAEELQGLLAGRLLEVNYFRGHKEIARRKEKEEQLHEAQREASAKVTHWANLNVFSDSPEEQERNRLADKRREAREKRLELEESRRMELLSHLDGYPPLHLYRQLGAVMGVLENLKPAKSYVIRPDGDVEEIYVVAPQALLLQSVIGLRRSFLKVFPGLPMPSLLAKQSRDHAPAHLLQENSPRHQLMRDFTQAMDRREGKKHMEDSLHHAAVFHRLTHARDNLSKKVSLLDRAVFWSDSDAQSQVSLAESRARHHQRALHDTWEHLLAQAQEASTALPPLYIREMTIRATLFAKSIGTTSGCSVNIKRTHAIETLQHLKTYMANHYGTQGSRQSLMSDIANALQKSVGEGERIDPTVFRTRSYQDMILLLAQPLRGSNFQKEFLHLSSTTQAWQNASQNEESAKARVSFWDWVNIFSQSEAEKERESFENEKEKLQNELTLMSHRVNNQLNHALQSYPPAQLYYMVDGVISALHHISARLVTTTTTDSKGRTRTTTTCKMSGKPAANKAMRRWNKTLLEGFGTLPDVHESLLRWVSY